MARSPLADLSRRERQVMDLLHRSGRATVGEVFEQMPDAPSYNAVRSILNVLEDKGHVKHSMEGRRYVYQPRQRSSKARSTALEDLVHTLFQGSTKDVVSTLLDLKATQLDDAEYDELATMIDRARRKGKR